MRDGVICCGPFLAITAAITHPSLGSAAASASSTFRPNVWALAIEGASRRSTNAIGLALVPFIMLVSQDARRRDSIAAPRGDQTCRSHGRHGHAAAARPPAT